MIEHPRASRAWRRLRRPARRDRLEPDHLVLRPAVVLVARADRRPGRRGAVRLAGGTGALVTASSTRSSSRWWPRPLVGFVARLPRHDRDHVDLPDGQPGKANRGFRMAQTVSAAAMALGPRPAGRRRRRWASSSWPSTPRHFQDTATRTSRWVGRSGPRRDLARHVRGRLADHAHPGPQDHRPGPGGGLRRRDGGQSVLFTTAYVLQAPISTTHTITSAIMGVGATKRLSAVRWGVAGVPVRGPGGPHRVDGGSVEWVSCRAR
jgi:hypothetical protein